jgi:hypothetical protein
VFLRVCMRVRARVCVCVRACVLVWVCARVCAHACVRACITTHQHLPQVASTGAVATTVRPAKNVPLIAAFNALREEGSLPGGSLRKFLPYIKVVVGFITDEIKKDTTYDPGDFLLLPSMTKLKDDAVSSLSLPS